MRYAYPLIFPVLFVYYFSMSILTLVQWFLFVLLYIIMCMLRRRLVLILSES